MSGFGFVLNLVSISFRHDLELCTVASKFLEAQSSNNENNPPQDNTMATIPNSKYCSCSILKPKDTKGKCILAFAILMTLIGLLTLGISCHYIIISSIIGHLNKTMIEEQRMIKGDVLTWNVTMNGDPNSYEFEPSFKNGSNLYVDNFLNQIE